MTTYYKCSDCGRIFGTWGRGKEHEQNEGHGTYPMAKRNIPIDLSVVEY